MSAPNFSPVHNTKNICAFALYQDYEKESSDYLADDCQPIDHDEWITDQKDYYTEALHERLTDRLKYHATISTTTDHDRLATIRRTVSFAGYSWPVSVAAVLHPGYYDGFTIDWEPVSVGDSYYDQLPDLDDLQQDLSNILNAGLAKILAPKLLARLTDCLDYLTTEIEAAITDIAPHKLACSIFSNGEGLYWDTDRLPNRSGAYLIR